MIEELKMCLQRKEKMLQDAVFARNQQAEEHMREVMDLLAMVSNKCTDLYAVRKQSGKMLIKFSSLPT